MAAQEITGATLAALPALNATKDEYTFIEATGDQADLLKHRKMTINDGGICSWSMVNAKNLLIEDVKYDLRAKKNNLSIHSI